MSKQPRGSRRETRRRELLAGRAGDPRSSASLAALLVGGVLLTARLARLGWVATFRSRPVLTGCTHGVAAVVIIAQPGKLLELDLDAQDPLAQLAGETAASSGATIGVACLAPLPPRRRAPRPPEPLLVVVVAIATSATGELEAHGVAVVGAIPSGLPNVTIPTWRLDHAVGLLPTPLGNSFAGFADQILSARSFAGKPTSREVGLLDLVGERHVDPTVRAAVQAAPPARKGPDSRARGAGGGPGHRVLAPARWPGRPAACATRAHARADHGVRGRVLLSAVAYDLVLEAVDLSGGPGIPLGIAAGALTFFIGDKLIDRAGGGRRKAVRTPPDVGSPKAIVLGTVLDGVPESIVVGLTLLGGEGVSIALLVAVFLSNVPEAMAGTSGLAASGVRRGSIMAMWTLITAVSGIAALAGYGLLGGAPQWAVPFVLAFAAGAALTMLADTMIPEAFDHGGREAGLITTLGFVVAFTIAYLERTG